MTLLSRRAALTVLVGALAALVARPAFAAASAKIGPGKTVTYAKLAPSGYTRVEVKNLGPGVATVTLTTTGFEEVITLEEGEVWKTAQIFQSTEMVIANSSETATIRIKTKWL